MGLGGRKEGSIMGGDGGGEVGEVGGLVEES